MKRLFLSRFKLLVGVVGGIVLLSIVYYFYPVSLCSQLRGVGLMEARSLYVLPIANGDTLFFSWQASDSLPKHLNTNPDSARSYSFSSAFFIAPSGRLFTALPSEAQKPEVLTESVLLPALHKEHRRIKTLRLVVQDQLKELDYYRKTHSVVDEGYDRVMTYSETLKQKMAQQDSLLFTVELLLKSKPTALLKTEYLLHWGITSESGVWHTEIIPCRLLNKEARGAMLMQTADSLLPLRAYCFTLPDMASCRWGVTGADYFLLGYHRYFQHVEQADVVHPYASGVRLQDSVFTVPTMPLAEGSPVVNALGHLVGMNLNGTLYPISDLHNLQQETSTFLSRFTADTKARWIQLKRKIQEARR